MDLELELEANIAGLQAFAHERLLALAASDSNVTTQLGPDASRSRSRLVRAQPVEGCLGGRTRDARARPSTFEHVIALGPITMSSKPL